jgi:hypothetical protein
MEFRDTLFYIQGVSLARFRLILPGMKTYATADRALRLEKRLDNISR